MSQPLYSIFDSASGAEGEQAATVDTAGALSKPNQPCQKTDKIVMRNTTFNSRETYLAYRSNWKAEYKKTSSNIRALTLAIKEDQRYPVMDIKEGKLLRGNIPAQAQARLDSAPTFPLRGFIYSRECYRAQAKEMLEELKAAKVEAQRQYLAAKASLQTA
jgi:hypothetical protein